MCWSFKQSIKQLPDLLQDFFVEEAEILLIDLETNRLEISLAVAPEPKFEGHKIRVVDNKNPYWYSNLYWDYYHFRRDRSVKALNRIKNKKDGNHGKTRYKYDCIYRELILERLINGYQEETYEVPPNNKVRFFFGKCCV